MRVGQRVEFLQGVNRGVAEVRRGVIWAISMDKSNQPRSLFVTRTDGQKAVVCAKTARVVS